MTNLLQIIDELLESADKLKDINLDQIKLMERYKVLSELDADPKSKHRMHIKINNMMIKTIKELQKYEK
jgi:hypothetical protein